MGISSALAGAVGAVPIGSVTAFAGSAAPSGWLLCGGQTVSRTQFSGLFLTIGTTYGAGDGSTTFALPDLRGRTIAGEDDMGGTAANRLTSGGSGINGIVLGATGGSQTHTLTTTEMPAHAHDIQRSNVAASSTGADASVVYRSLANTGATYTNTQNTGSGGAHNNTQPTIVLNYIIKAA
jgi:microcystin-dependent protein